jgi:two-component system, NarL family, sensor histidine kinase DevS
LPEFGLHFPDQPRVELDRRLSDLVEAANEVLATQGRLRALLRANHAITAQLDLDSLLRSIVDSARQLTGAQYAALGVLGEHGGLSRFIHAGMEEDQVARIGHLPRGEGLLGTLISHPQPVRIPDIAADPRSAGFPAEHPPMRDFLGVPVRVRGVVYGNLYLTNHPGGGFTLEDEELVHSLADTAGFAVENARLYGQTQRREAWAAASGEVTAGLLGDADVDPLALVSSHVLELADAKSVFVMLVSDDGAQMSVVDVQGEDPEALLGMQLPVPGSLADHLLRSRVPQRFDEDEVRRSGVAHTAPFGPIMLLPLSTPDRVLGALVVGRTPGMSAFAAADLVVAADFAGRASVAIELRKGRAEAERTRLFEERARIARDLHDRVIQQLFATGMQLQSVLGTLPAGRNAERVDASITALDDSITQIRRIIFTLESTGRGTERSTGRQRLFDLIEQLASAHSMEPALSVTGPVDAVLDGDLAEDVLAVVREAVSNAVKHAGATGVSVAVSADARGVTATVSNDGIALADSGRRSGLRNLEQRAVRRGGTMHLGAEDGRTVLTWSAPLRMRAPAQ